VRQLAQTVEAHGGGAVSLDVAFDLALYEVVEQAKTACRATGSAIALERGGEFICRAASGAAPDLGVRVETSSGLVAECLHTAQAQHCADTETDARVNADACRWLGVRSMLMAPVVEEGRVLGVLEVFSDRPNAFAVSDLATLVTLSQRIAQHKKEVEQGLAARTPAPQMAIETAVEPAKDYGEVIPPEEPEGSAGGSAWTPILGLLVIAAAIALGLAVGWRGAARGNTPAVTSRATESPAANTNSATGQETSPVNAPVAEDPGSASAQKTSSLANHEIPSGGLIVTQNGKVIYRMDPSVPSAANSGQATARASSSSGLIHRVEPQYPPEARERHVQGSVVLNVQVQGGGTVGNIDVIQGDPLLTEAAVQAVRQWRYQPYLVDGRPVETQTQVTINFTLPPD
jgi:TonB family protein